jgi:catechol 2,3-dioxygenase-like lactoylglutathione lyase family enzyme
VLGRFHEISIGTPDIRASVEFYERLGFTHAATGDTWRHSYGVLTDGRVFIGLHQDGSDDTALTFVRSDIGRHVADFEQLGIELTRARTSEDVFNEIAFADPTGQKVRVLEARTYSPPQRDEMEVSACGYFSQFSIPGADRDEARRFWERFGFIASDAAERPYEHLPLTSDHLNIAFHRPRTFDRPLLVFAEPDMAAYIAKLAERGIEFARGLPKTLQGGANALLEAPEGTALLLVTSPTT